MNMNVVTITLLDGYIHVACNGLFLIGHGMFLLGNGGHYTNGGYYRGRGYRGHVGLMVGNFFFFDRVCGLPCSTYT